jgi:phosphoribosylformimino-5-aminoimidazole carboxamide ribotide isomerase
MGARSAYRPIETPLSASADPVEVVQGFLRLADFPVIYIADLDAICRQGNNTVSLTRLRRSFPRLNFWIDGGANDAASIDVLRAFGEPVVGSESQRDLSLFASRVDGLLSLDFRGDDFLGPKMLLTSPHIWPDRVIAMTLTRVGSGEGPDLKRISAIRAISGSRQLFAAGGIRNIDDIASLREAGVLGALVATALHDGRIGARDL